MPRDRPAAPARRGGLRRPRRLVHRARHALGALGFKPRSLAVEWDDAACKTAVAAGHPRVRADVARFHLDHLLGLVWLLILSPPCQAWSRSGKRKGILDQPAIFAHAMRVIAAGEWIDYADAGPLPRVRATRAARGTTPGPRSSSRSSAG
jgi:hypothetical protein